MGVTQYVQQHGGKLVAQAPHVVIHADDQENGYSYWRDADTLRRLIGKCQEALRLLEVATKEHEQR